MAASKAIITVLVLLPPAAVLAQPAGKVLDLDFGTRDLVYDVEDMGGTVQTLAVTETDTELRMELASDVLFDFDSAELQPKAQETMQQVADFIREHANGEVRIEGHTDSKGPAAYNLGLSERRARAVEAWLQDREGLDGLPEVRFVSKGFGETQPVAPNAKPDGSDDPDGRQKNRRVEIVVRKQ